MEDIAARRFEDPKAVLKDLSTHAKAIDRNKVGTGLLDFWLLVLW